LSLRAVRIFGIIAEDLRFSQGRSGAGAVYSRPILYTGGKSEVV